MPEFLNAFIQWADSSKYLLLFIGAILEGPVVMLLGGFLLRLGQFDFFPMYTALLLGDLVADGVWYTVGYYAARPFMARFGKFFHVTPEVVEKVEKRFKKYQDRILVISKLTMGFGLSIATLITAGMLKVSFKRYMALNFFGGIVWTLFLIIIGFFFGDVYTRIHDSLKVIFVLAFIVIAFFGFKKANDYLAQKPL